MIAKSFTKPVRWSPEEDALLVEQYGTELTDSLCKILGRSWRSVMARLSRLGLRKTKSWSSEDLAWLLDNTGGDMTHKEMAEVLGRTTKAVNCAVGKYGMQRHRRGLTEHEQQRFQNLHTRGYSDLLIARRLKTTKARIVRHRVKRGLPGNGWTKHSVRATVASRGKDFNQRLRNARGRNRKQRRVPEDTLVGIARAVIEDKDELLSVAWDAVHDAWVAGTDDMDALQTAGRDGIRAYYRSTQSYLSIDAFVNDDGQQFEFASRGYER
jgi:hypothetical protein